MKYKLLSTRDAFSGIYNKRAARTRWSNTLRAASPKAKCAFIILDLDDFKRVNDTSGHLTGDTVLRRTGDMLKELFRASDVIGRFGGDEFVVLAKGMASREGVERKCRKIRERMAAFLPGRRDGKAHMQHRRDPGLRQAADYQSVFKQADAALYEAKKMGKDALRHPRIQGRRGLSVASISAGETEPPQRGGSVQSADKAHNRKKLP